ncbi:MAG: glycosyltransferase family A protein [Candidatus Diapherotrites archaeon]|nr:glycosyltransferase family A protein [Candidatus Diapherotrites archaeon]
MAFPGVSVIVATRNRAGTVVKAVKGILAIDYPSNFEIIVVNDGSTDNTRALLEKDFGKNKKVSLINFEKNYGVCKARNAGIRRARYQIIANMDHDCIPSKNWLKNLVEPFTDKNVGITSSYGGYGGTSTAFRKEIALKIGGYDEDYFYYREDTDFAFKIIEAGYEFKSVKADYVHDHVETKPQGFFGLAGYVFQRLKYHQNDVLLYKKHPTDLTRKFLDIKFGFLVNPAADFGLATGRWKGKGGLEVSSPRGIKFIENKSPLHSIAIVFLGICYMLGLKAARLYASLRFGKLLL